MTAPNNISYWVASTEAPSHAPLGGDADFDVAVIGAGIVGLTCALLLKQAGKSVAVLEMDRVGAGVTGYTSAKVTSGHNVIYSRLIDKHGIDKARAYARANEGGLARIASLIDEHSIECDFERKRNYVYTESQSEVATLESEVDAARRVGLNAVFTTETSLPFDVAGALYQEDQAQFHPRKYLLGLARLVVGDDCTIYENTRVTDVDERSLCVVEARNGRVRAEHVVVATHFPILDRGLLFARVHPKRSYCVTGPIDRAAAPDGMFISSNSPTRSIRTIPDGDRTLLLVGGNGHAVGQKRATEAEYDDLASWMGQRFGVNEVTHRWSTQDGTTVDLIPYAGTLRRGSDRIYTATGFGKWGLTNGTAAAEVIADGILGRPNELSSLYDPHRLTVKESLPTFVEENAKVAAHFVGDRLKLPSMEPFEGLAAGEGGVERDALKPVAAYRDESGELHAVSAVCTHLGCIVAWNGAEKSWDCPCHGSRFDVDGRVIQGPAVKDLEQWDLSS